MPPCRDEPQLLAAVVEVDARRASDRDGVTGTSVGSIAAAPRERDIESAPARTARSAAPSGLCERVRIDEPARRDDRVAGDEQCADIEWVAREVSLLVELRERFVECEQLAVSDSIVRRGARERAAGEQQQT